MRVLWTLLCLFLVQLAHGQNYTQYHLYINEAEKWIVNDNADSVFWYYDKAFSEYEQLFVKDPFIAAQYSFKHKDTSRTRKYLLLAAKNGMQVFDLNTSYIFDDFKTSPSYVTLANQIAEAYEAYLHHIDRSLSDEWRRRFFVEQEAKNANDAYEYISIVRENVNKIRTALKDNRYPGEYLIGMSGDAKVPLVNYYPFYSLAHYNCVVAELHDELWKAVLHGQLHPRDFAVLAEYERLFREGKSDKKPNRTCDERKYLPLKFNLAWYNETDEKSLWEVKSYRSKYLIQDEAIDKQKKALEKSEGYRFFFDK